MARLAQAPITPGRTISTADPLPDLNRLLARLQENILHADAERERRLRTSEYERAKARVNIDYARSLLTKLEQDALAIKVLARRHEMQADLNQKREALEQITERFRELEEISVDSDDDSSEGEDLLGDIIATPSESIESTSVAGRQGDDNDDDGGDAWGEQDNEAEAEAEADESTVLPTPQTQEPSRISGSTTSAQRAPTAEPAAHPPPATSTSQTLRSRTTAATPQQPQHHPTTTTTTTTEDKASTTALRTQLFGARTDATSTTATATATATTEAIIDHHRAEQDKLTESMVGMARALKESTQRFASSLREDEDVVRAAGANLERNERGLGAVAGRMGALRRATEGKGWWGRVVLYVWIAGLAVFAVLLVFVFPKLRF